MRYFLLMAVALALSACASTPIGIGQVPDAAARTARVSEPPIGDYTIGPGDLIEFRLLGDPSFDTVQRVRADGRITLPLIEDEMAAGLTLTQLRARLVEAYHERGVLKPDASGSRLRLRKSDVALPG